MAREMVNRSGSKLIEVLTVFGIVGACFISYYRVISATLSNLKKIIQGKLLTADSVIE